MKTALLLPALLLLAGPLAAVDHGMLNFEDDAVLSRIRVGTGQASLSDRRHLGGRRSLRWDYRPGDTLEIDFPPWFLTDREATVKYGTEARTILTINIYNETPLPEKALRVEFGRRGRSEADCGFDFFLNFTGWRTAWPVYSRDMDGAPHKEMNLIRMRIPDGVPAGTLYFDNLIPSSLAYERFQENDLQVPAVRDKAPDSDTSADSFPMRVRHLRPQAAASLTNAERQGFRLVEKQLLALISGTVKPRSVSGDRLKQSVAEMRKLFARTGVERHPDGRVTGRPLRYGVLHRQYTYVPDGEKELAEFIDLRQYGTIMLKIALLHRNAAEEAARTELLDRYLLLLDHLIDQGYVYGSSLGSRVIVGYGTRELFNSFLLMRRELTAAGRNGEIARIGIWHYDLNSYLNPEDYTNPNADYFNIKSRAALISILMMDDSPEKAAYLAAFSRFISRNLGWETPGWTGGLKPDGCAYHHWGHYPSYFFGGMEGATALCRSLAHSPWAISADGVANLKRALLAATIYCNPAVPPTQEGRVPFRGLTSLGIIKNIGLLAETGDDELAAVFRRLAPEAGARRFPNIAPAPRPEGHWSFNYGGFGIHRFGDKAVTLKTFNRYIWGSEIYQSENRYGRYWSYGAVFILGTGKAADEGLSAKGWDWNRVPGATTLHRPWPELVCPVRHTEMRTMPENRINGSSHLHHQFGVFGSIVTEPDRKSYDPKFRVVSSVFAFGPRLVALGSGIRAGAPHPVETTLFQYATDGGKRPGFFNSAAPHTGSDTDLSAVPEAGKPVWTADFRGNVWLVAAGGPVRFLRRRQESPDQRDQKKAAADFATAVIDHGVRPQNARYEYLIRLDLKPEDAPAAAAELARQKTYTVLQQDDAAHALRDHASGVTAAAIFQPVADRQWDLFAAADRPCYVLFRRPAEHTLELSLNTADLAGFVRRGYSDLEKVEADEEAEKRDRTVTVRLRGEWLPASGHPVDPRAVVTAADGVTTVTGRFRHGIPIQLNLTERTAR